MGGPTRRCFGEALIVLGGVGKAAPQEPEELGGRLGHLGNLIGLQHDLGREDRQQHFGDIRISPLIGFSPEEPALDLDELMDGVLVGVAAFLDEFRHQLLDRPNPLSLFVAHRHARQGRGPGWGWRYPTERNLKRALRAALATNLSGWLDPTASSAVSVASPSTRHAWSSMSSMPTGTSACSA